MSPGGRPLLAPKPSAWTAKQIPSPPRSFSMSQRVSQAPSPGPYLPRSPAFPTAVTQLSHLSPHPHITESFQVHLLNSSAPSVPLHLPGTHQGPSQYRPLLDNVTAPRWVPCLRNGPRLHIIRSSGPFTVTSCLRSKSLAQPAPLPRAFHGSILREPGMTRLRHAAPRCCSGLCFHSGLFLSLGCPLPSHTPPGLTAC